MPRRAALVTEAEIARAIRAARRAGAAVVEIHPDGLVLVRLDRPSELAAAPGVAPIDDEPEIVM
ncbi:hypothetical protein [Rhodoplanes serenus]|uniref:hypothetical protein n=1 Tax=Rhodoplanes serenus TaxID=200615 RepID=UPI000DAE9D91|nr:hypothetical protein [Rhodoplanes serenus]RAI34775.1 hypothetical protein CH340_08000 [Rhodoplanes serenus]